MHHHVSPPVIVGRYAPSPSGRQHVGNARTALLAWLHARAAGGRFILRSEDLDPSRCRRSHEETILADLRWLGLDWDEGPDVGGAHGPYRQSARDDVYAAALARLEVFACTCTRRELREVAAAPHGVEPVYPGTCRDRRRSGTSAIRWATPRGTAVAEDVLLGTLAQDVEREIGDFVLRRADGAWAYQLAVVVDDAAMGVTDVVRGVDLWPSTPRQVWLGDALGLRSPRYLHVPLVMGPGGEKLSKRDGVPDVASLRESGVDPTRVVAALAASCGLVPPTTTRVTAGELVSSFDARRLHADNRPIDLARLRAND